jgi:cytochrome P450
MTIPDTQTTPRLPWDPADPYPFYEDRRRDGNIVWDDIAQAWLVLSHREARDILAGPDWSADPRANAGAELLNSAIVEANMLFTDGLAHTRLRNAVRDLFSRNFIAGLADGVETITAGIVDAIPTGRPFDAMAEIALPLPVAVIGAWLGLDPEQCTALREHSPAIIRLLGGFTDQDALDEGLAASAALIADFLPAAADRRAHPRDDLLSYLAADRDLSLDEVTITAILIAVAGHETTANLLGAAFIRLLTPDPNGCVPSGQFHGDESASYTELLRLDAPVQATARTATADHHIDGITISTGSSVVLCLAAANRDPLTYPAPDQFRPGRTGPPPLTFGHGAHYCLGAALARLETTIALRNILLRMPELTAGATWRDTPAIRGPQTIPARFTCDAIRT